MRFGYSFYDKKSQIFIPRGLVLTDGDKVASFADDVLISLAKPWDPPGVDQRVTGTVHVAAAVSLLTRRTGVRGQWNCDVYYSIGKTTTLLIG